MTKTAPATSLRHIAGFTLAVCGLYILFLAPSLLSPTVDWREADVLMVARNLCRGEGSLWLPRISAAGAEPAITGMEFPILNWIIGGIACDDRGMVPVARVLSLLLSLCGIAAVAGLAFRHLSRTASYIAVVAYAFSPIILFYGRASQPDVPSTALALVAVLLLDLSTPRVGPTNWPLWFGSAAVMAVACLIKIPVIVYGLPMVALLLERKGLRAAADPKRWLYLPIALIPPAVWYSHARALQRDFGVHYFHLGSSWETLRRDWTTPAYYERLFFRQFLDTYAFPLLSVSALLSLLFLARKMPRWIPAMAAAAVVFLFLGGWVAAWHWCYGVVAVAPIAFASSYGLQRCLDFLRWPRLQRVLTCAIIATTIGYGTFRSFKWLTRPEEATTFRASAAVLDANVPTNSPVAVISDGDPKALWYFDRKGWVVSAAADQGCEAPIPDFASALVLDKTRLKLKGCYERVVGSVEASGGYRSIARNSVVEVWVRASATAN